MTVPGKGGRPTDYKEDYCKKAYKLCLLGATDKEMADIFGVAESTLNLWKKEHKEFSESLKMGKEAADANVANRLYQRAMGYQHPEDKIFNDNGEPLIVPTTKHYPPDPTAAIFWLKNRQPQKWRDKQEIDTNISGGIEVSFTSPDLDDYAK
ncbi:MAG: hypothetical protein GXY34_03605 [Syntrophomonadaceae bacterium]|nr:hypothetical protein [Syntrophomonadaceae bacterium]